MTSDCFPTATPRPWFVDTVEGGGWAVVAAPTTLGAQVIADLDDTVGDRAANASLIVAAVNAFTSPSPNGLAHCGCPLGTHLNNCAALAALEVTA